MYDLGLAKWYPSYSRPLRVNCIGRRTFIIRRGTFRSVRELQRAIAAFVSEHNKNAKPFVWTKSAATILRKIKKCHTTYGSAH